MLWGLFCTSSWTWCIGMFLPFLLLRLWGWPGFWAFFIPNVLGCALFGFVLTPERSRTLVKDLGWMMAVFSAVTVAYQCFFAGWASHEFFVRQGAMTTVVSTGVPIGMLMLAMWLALRRDRDWLAMGAMACAAAWVAIAWSLAAGDTGMSGAAPGDSLAISRAPLVPLDRLTWAVPTIAFGFLLCPYLDLTFHRAVQNAPQPRLAFATFGACFALMLLGVATLYRADSGTPEITPALAVLWAVQLTFTTGAHIRELFKAPPSAQIPAWIPTGLVALAVLLGTPAFALSLGPALPVDSPALFGGAMRTLLPGEPVYLAFLGAYGLLFPAYVWIQGRGGSQRLFTIVVLVGLPCYLLGAWEFATYLMPVPVLLAALGAWNPRTAPASTA